MADDAPDKPAPAADPNQITQAQKDSISDWFKRVAPNGASCPICGSKTWSGLNHFVTPVALGGPNRDTLLLGGPAYPHFMLGCMTCGNTQFINAYKAGILPVPSPKKEGDK